ncbi:hypothetical protein EVA_12657 [gut metagenome]|uniref:Uncharacterized protein n=1 Tax=gut metagenome TaxID=749906 RepID=J9GIA7_9ZZZZ
MDGYAVPNIFYAQNFSYSILSLLNSAVKKAHKLRWGRNPFKKKSANRKRPKRKFVKRSINLIFRLIYI